MDTATHDDQAREVSWASLDPVEREMLAALHSPDLFARVVDSLPPSPERFILRQWGMVRGHYPITEETKRALTDEVRQLYEMEKGGGAAHSR
jgi:hypothetical protein